MKVKSFKYPHFISTQILTSFLMVLFFSPANASNQKNNECHFTVGVVPQFEQRRIFDVWSTILSELKTETGCSFELVGSTSIIEFEKAFKAGIYDFAYMNPYHAVMAKKAQGYIPIIRSGVKKLKGVLVVKKNSTISDITELKNQDVAFPSPNALGASLLMRAELSNTHGVNVKPKYVKTHSSVYLHVAKGLVAAGGGVGRTLAEQPNYIKDNLRVLYTTTPVNAHPFVAHPRVGLDYIQRIQHSWLSLAEKNATLFEGVPMHDSIAADFKDYKPLDDLGLEHFIGTKD